MDDANSRPIAGPLKVGLFLMPIVFAWFLLGRGYSTKARLWGFGWMIAVVIMAVLASPETGNATVVGASEWDV